MSSGLLGLDVPGTYDLAARLRRWEVDADHIVGQLLEAERLGDLLVDSDVQIDQIGNDGHVMASALHHAAQTLESFSLNMPPASQVAAAVNHVLSFTGTDNDPEGDRRLQALRTLIQQTGRRTDRETALIMSQLLSNDQVLDVRHRDLDSVRERRGEVERLNALESSGSVSANDPRIDSAVRELRAALSAHATGDVSAQDLLSGFMSDRTTETGVLLATLLTGFSKHTVRVAHDNDLDYDVADAVVTMSRVDRQTAAISGGRAPAFGVDQLRMERRELLVQLLGVDDALLLRALTDQLDSGASAMDAFRGLEDHATGLAEQNQVLALAHELDVSVRHAEEMLARMQTDGVRLIESGFDPDDVAHALALDAHGAVPLAELEAIAAAHDTTLTAAADRYGTAEMMGMTWQQHDALLGIKGDFDYFDTAGEPDATSDGLISVHNLNHVLNHEPKDSERYRWAVAFLTTDLRHRTDTAQDNDDVIGSTPFGADHAGDNLWSQDDLRNLEFKQAVNFFIRPHLDAIDVAHQGGDPELADGFRSKDDVETFLRNNRDALSEHEVWALETVLAGNWYDKTFWQEHGDEIVLAAALVAGASVVVLSGGTLTHVAYAAVAGAATFSGATLVLNVANGDPWHQDVGRNAGIGALAGVSVLGLGSAWTTWAGASSTGLRAATALGAVSDASGLVALGVTDPALGLVLHDEDIQTVRGVAGVVSLATGVASVGVASGSITAGSTDLAATRVGRLRNLVRNEEFPRGTSLQVIDALRATLGPDTSDLELAMLTRDEDIAWLQQNGVTGFADGTTLYLSPSSFAGEQSLLHDVVHGNFVIIDAPVHAASGPR